MKRAKIIAAEAKPPLPQRSGKRRSMMMRHPLRPARRNPQSLVEIGVDRNTTVVFPAPLMSTIGEWAFLRRAGDVLGPGDP